MHQEKCLSLLNAVEEAIELNKAEAARISKSVHQLREILRSMKAQPISAPEEEPSSVNAEEDPGLLPEERQEMALLERVLEKALRVRCGSGAPPRGPGAAGREGGDGTERAQTASDKVASQSSSKPIKAAPRPGTEGKAARRPTAAPLTSRNAGGQRRHLAGPGRGSAQNRAVVPGKGAPPHRSGTGKQSVPAPATGEQRPAHTSAAGGPQQACPSGLWAEDSGITRATREALCEDPVSARHTLGIGAGDGSVSAQKGDRKPLIASSVWRAQRAKHSRLWDRVLATMLQPVVEKTRFTERLLSTLPTAVLCCSPVDARAEVGRLSQLCGALAHCFQTELQAAGAGRLPGSGGCWEMEYESQLMQEGLEKVVSELQRRVEHLKRDSDARDRWKPGRCCPVRRRGRWGDPAPPHLSPVLSYTSEAELKELEELRLRVALLQQEIHLHQALRDSLAPCLTSTLSNGGRPSASMLRSLYSLLGEGGAQFPAVVLDTEPD
ncbi:hypothetical protein MATL_G00218450 [Megalops atlanticus]|uniref:Tubulin epsilon and delta complex protein 2 n=1 Tax=Megalops atlanticus TaxID=7932 RepID=A0A9D3PL02_MEGAT|nr:hypothetical protein MATL_G00218450 [Megalops atlanticus]